MENRRTALITGASRGIGRATALRFAAEYDIVAVARSEAELDTLADEIAAAGGTCHTIALDLARGAEAVEALAEVEADVLVNNAGVGFLKPFLDLTPEEWHAMVDLNVNALYYVTRAVLPGMMERGRGHIVFVGSIAGRSAFIGGSCYAATKWAVMGMSESLMLEVRDSGVKVSVVNPGSVASHFSHRADPTWMLSNEEVATAIWQVVDTPPDVLIHRMEIRPLTPKKH
jgi:3-oxoacyl-[acyl-carrier protein] reductase